MAAAAFSHERMITPGGAGPNRLEVDVALLTGAHMHLRDLRLFDARQREVPYLLVDPKVGQRWIKDGHLLPIPPSKTSSGWEVDLGRAEVIDRVSLGVIEEPFMKRVSIEGSGDRARWTRLADTTVFDLPESQLQRAAVAFAPGRYRYIRAVFDDRSSAPVTLQSILARQYEPEARLNEPRLEVPFARRASEPGKSRYRIRLPGPHLALNAVEIEVAGGNVFRTATVTEPRLEDGAVTPENLGTATLRRAESGGMVAAEMVIQIAPPDGREIDLVIDDGNNPPLTITAIRVRFPPQPWIYFESPDGAPLVARYGNPALAGPSYDLEASRAYVERKKVARATWSSDPKPAPSAAPQKLAIPLGARVDRERFRFSRRIPDAPAGLAVLLLDLHALAHTDPPRDVRIVDAQARQVPFLLESPAEPLTVKLPPPPRTARGSASTYRIELPYANLPGDALVLSTTARVFERNVVMRGRGRGNDVLTSSTWRHSDPEVPAPSLRIELPPRTPRVVELTIDEGDNAPLPVESVHLVVASKALRFSHPGTPLFLLYSGRRGVLAPRYDLSLLAPQLFAEPARELTLGAPPPVREAADDDREGRKLFWIGIVIAAVVLVAMLLRLVLVRPETSHAPSDTT